METLTNQPTLSNTQNRVPLISIVTITYNASKQIIPTLKSLKDQTFHDFEHIVIDGASTDGTQEIVKRTSPSSILHSEPDKGLYYAMNKGLDKARGKYLLFLNAGDSLHDDNSLSLYAKAIHTYNHPDIIYGDTEIVNEQRKLIGRRHLSSPEHLTFNSFANGMLVCHQAFMVRRDLAPSYDTRYQFSADYEWTLRCLKNADSQKNINLHAVTIDYLQEGLTTRNHRKSLLERYRIMCLYYGTIPTILRHIRFAIRALIR